jgi:hypothetical protein
MTRPLDLDNIEFLTKYIQLQLIGPTSHDFLVPPPAVLGCFSCCACEWDTLLRHLHSLGYFSICMIVIFYGFLRGVQKVHRNNIHLKTRLKTAFVQ